MKLVTNKFKSGGGATWEACSDSSSACPEIPRILWNPKVHCRVHNSLPLVPILSRINPIHALQNSFCKIYFNIILLYIPRYSKWPLSLRFLHQTLYAPLLSPHTCYIFRPSHSFRFDIPNNTVIPRLTTWIRSKKCVVRRLRRCANVIECTYTNLDSIFTLLYIFQSTQLHNKTIS